MALFLFHNYKYWILADPTQVCDTTVVSSVCVTSTLSVRSALVSELNHNLIGRASRDNNFQRSQPGLPRSQSGLLGSQAMDVFEFTDFDNVGGCATNTNQASGSDLNCKARRINPIPAVGSKNSQKFKVKLKSKRNWISYIKFWTNLFL